MELSPQLLRAVGPIRNILRRVAANKSVSLYQGRWPWLNYGRTFGAQTIPTKDLDGFALFLLSEVLLNKHGVDLDELLGLNGDSWGRIGQHIDYEFMTFPPGAIRFPMR